jgi:hypothetical protein
MNKDRIVTYFAFFIFAVFVVGCLPAIIIGGTFLVEQRAGADQPDVEPTLAPYDVPADRIHAELGAFGLSERCEMPYPMEEFEAYNARVVELLAELIADPVTQALPPDTIAGIFRWGAAGTGPVTVEMNLHAGAEGHLLADMQLIYCRVGSHDHRGHHFYVFDRAGNFWPVGEAGHLFNILWAGDRWIVEGDADYMNSSCTPRRIWHVIREGDKWARTEVLTLGGGDEGCLFMLKVDYGDGFRRVTARYKYGSHEPPCALPEKIDGRVYDGTIYEVEASYEWAGDAYEQTARDVIGVEVRTRAEDYGNYEALEDWHAFCRE